MSRPNQDRTALTVWVKRSSLAWLTQTAKDEGKPRSALVRDLLSEAIAARQVRTAVLEPAIREHSACRRCENCTGYVPGRRPLSCQCGHSVGDH